MFSTVNEDQIKVCNCDKQTPLLFTFKFQGAEYWCPRCGYTSGMFGAGINIACTPELEKSLKDWREKAKKFLSDETKEWEYSKDCF